jgi:hypothetical protein
MRHFVIEIHNEPTQLAKVYLSDNYEVCLTSRRAAHARPCQARMTLRAQLCAALFGVCGVRTALAGL